MSETKRLTKDVRDDKRAALMRYYIEDETKLFLTEADHRFVSSMTGGQLRALLDDADALDEALALLEAIHKDGGWLAGGFVERHAGEFIATQSARSK